MRGIGSAVLSLVALAFVASTAGQLHYSTPQQVFDAMRGTFQADKARGVHVRYEFELSGPHGGHWSIEVNDGKFVMQKTPITNPDVTFSATDQDWVALANGTLAGWWAHISGRLKIKGSQALARKLDELFP
jgi:putative sterol carrier protein